MKTLARRVGELTAEHEALTKALNADVAARNPTLHCAHAVGPDTAALPRNLDTCHARGWQTGSLCDHTIPSTTA